MAKNARRDFLRRTAALTGGALAAGGAARAAPLAIPPTNQEPGRIIDEAVEEIGLHDDGRAELAAGPVAVGPVHQNDFSSPHDFFR